ncbi:unnamed protein product [Discula destructiva]
MAMPQALRQLLILVIDSLYGSLLYLPLSVVILIRAITGAGSWNESHIPSLDGRVALVTGANAGIGYYTVKQLAAKGAKVYLGARSESRATEAIRKLLQDNPSIPKENLVWLRLDLSSQSQTVEAAKEFLLKEDRLDILVNNAGIDPYSYDKTSDGFDMTMAVNHIGHWTLTHCLEKLLQSTAQKPNSDVRVVTVSSSGHAAAPKTNNFTSIKDLDDPCASAGWESSCLAQSARYGLSKLANILFANELQRRMDEDNSNVLSLSINPGPVKTEGALPALPFLARPMVALFFTAPAKGALTQLFAATATEVSQDKEKYKGAYLDGPGSIKTPATRALDVILARNLWKVTEAAVKAVGALDTF